MPKVTALAFMASVGLVSSAFGQTPVEFGISGVGPGGPNLAGVYTDPYIGYYNNDTALGSGTGNNPAIFSPANATQVAAFCDDFANEVNPPQYWNAYDTSLTALPTGTPPLYYGMTSGSSYTNQGNETIYDSANGQAGVGVSSNALHTLTFSQTAGYIAVAYLAHESQIDTGDASAQEIYSFALWGVFDPALLGSATNPYGSMTGQDLTTARTDLAQALGVGEYYAGLTNGTTQFQNNLGINVQIYSAVGGSPGNTSSPQEFVTVTPASTQGYGVPELSSWATLGLDLGSLALLGVIFRRYRAQLQGD